MGRGQGRGIRDQGFGDLENERPACDSTFFTAHCRLPTAHYFSGNLAIRSTISSAARAQSTPLLPRLAVGASLPVVAALAAGAGDRLFERVAGENAEQHRQPVVDADFAQGRAHRPVDVLVVRGFAADDRPQADHRHVAAAGGQAVGHGGNLERAGRPGHVDAVVGHAVGDERLHRALQQARGDRSR